jgi:hypothetical protein
MQINLIDDASVSAAPAGFTTAIASAAQFLDNLVTNPITVSILVGWGEDDNGTYPIGSNLSLGGALAGIALTYSQLRSDLVANVSTAVGQFALASLPMADPTNGGSFFVSNAEAKALGLLPATGNEIDGAIGFNATYPYNFGTNAQGNTTGLAVSGQLDLFNDAVLELTHALGMELGNGSEYTAEMMFRYAATGVRELAVNGFLTPPAYFSIDGGKTNLDNYDATLGDSTLWNGSAAGNDTYAIPYNYGAGHVYSLADATELNVLGFNVNTAVLENNGTIYGTSGGETLYAFELPNNAAFGGSGSDTIIFTANRNDYTVTVNSNDSISVTNGTLTNQFYNVAYLQFADQTFATAGATPGVLSAFSLAQQTELIYIGYFDRSADGSGFGFWEGQDANAQAGGQSAALALTNIANSFTPQAETIALYPFLANPNPNFSDPTVQAGLSTFIENVYSNLFGHAADSGGLAYWVGQIETGAVGLGAAVLAIANGAQGSDATSLQNKTTVALDFTNLTKAANLPINTAFFAEAKSVLVGVDGISLNDASVAAAEAAIAPWIASHPQGALVGVVGSALPAVHALA